MLSFFRNHSRTIGWGIVVVFVGSLFTGTVFLGRHLMQERREKSADAVAFVGKYPIERLRFNNYLNQTLSRFSGDDINKLDPEILELVEFSALSQTIQWTIFYKGAEEKNLTVGSDEFEGALQGLYRDYDVKGLKELKALLKKNNYPYKDFKQNLEDDLRSQKFVQYLETHVPQASSQDVTMAYTRINIQHLLIKSGTANAMAAAKIRKIQGEIAAGLSFEAAIAKYSEDPKSNTKQGKLGWMSTQKITPEIAKVAYSLTIKRLSSPIKSPVGYHLIRVLDRATLIPPTLNITQLKDKVHKDMQRHASQEYVESFIRQNPLLVVDPILKAYNAKMSGDIPSAIGAYQSQISNVPTSPIPHYLLAKLYLQTHQRALAIQELQKASLKAQLNKGTDFIALHLLLGKLYKEDGDNAKKQSEYRQAITAAGVHGPSLSALVQQLKKLGEPTLAKEAEAKLKH